MFEKEAKTTHVQGGGQAAVQGAAQGAKEPLMFEEEAKTTHVQGGGQAAVPGAVQGAEVASHVETIQRRQKSRLQSSAKTPDTKGDTQEAGQDELTTFEEQTRGGGTGERPELTIVPVLLETLVTSRHLI